MEAETKILQAPTFSDLDRLARIKKKPQILQLNDIYPEGMGSHCGYCQKEDGNLQWSFSKKKMDPYTYQLLMERGWRRCGTYYYKPNLQKSCCKLFTHRLEVGRFKPKKDQKKALKKVIAIAYQKVQEMEIQDKQVPNKNDKKKQQNYKKTNQKAPVLQVQQITKQKLLRVCLYINNSLKNNLFGLLNNSGLTEEKFNSQYTFDNADKIKFFVSKPGENSDYYSNHTMLLFGLNKKLFGNPKYSLIDFSKDLKAFVEGLGLIQNYRLSVQRGGYLLFKKEAIQKSNSFQILDEKQQKIEQVGKSEKMQQEPEKTGLVKMVQTIKNKIKSGNNTNLQEQSQMIQQKKASKNFQILQLTHKYRGELNITHNKITFGKITIQIVPAEENVESFKIYQEYTSKIHQKKQKKLSSYVNFLCLQGLDFRKQTSKISNQVKEPYIPSWDPTSKHQQPKPVSGQVQKLLGCYHMKYFFQGNLIAVGVVDIVDDGLSSVYFFYDPKFKQCRLGVFSSLIQIEYVRWMRLSFPEFRYYYMGFYISNSEKMNYKIDYMPCQLLCPITYRFVQFTEEIKQKTDRIASHHEKDIRLAKKQEEIIDDMHFKKDLGPFIDKYLKLIYQGRPIILKQINPHFFVHILRILNINVPVYGKKVFQSLTFSI